MLLLDMTSEWLTQGWHFFGKYGVDHTGRRFEIYDQEQLVNFFTSSNISKKDFLIYLNLKPTPSNLDGLVCVDINSNSV